MVEQESAAGTKSPIRASAKFSPGSLQTCLVLAQERHQPSSSHPNSPCGPANPILWANVRCLALSPSVCCYGTMTSCHGALYLFSRRAVQVGSSSGLIALLHAFKMLRSLAVSLSIANSALAAYSFDPLEHLAGIAPYFEPSDPPLDPKPAQGCNVTRAAYLVRHAAIYANDFDYEEYIEPFTDKLGNTSVDWSRAGPLAFLATWQTPISDSEIEDLTKVGQLESYKLGVDVSMRYPGLKPPQKVWTSTAERTTLSADSFIEGISTSNDTERVSVPESAAEGADSLTPYKGCPKYSSSFGSEQSSVCTASIRSEDIR